jgi:hypothetical protein
VSERDDRVHRCPDSLVAQGLHVEHQLLGEPSAAADEHPGGVVAHQPVTGTDGGLRRVTQVGHGAFHRVEPGRRHVDDELAAGDQDARVISLSPVPVELHRIGRRSGVLTTADAVDDLVEPFGSRWIQLGELAANRLPVFLQLLR